MANDLMTLPSLASGLAGATLTPTEKLTVGVLQLIDTPVKRIEAKVDAFIQQFSQAPAGVVNTQETNRGVAGVAVYGGSLYKGGSYILSDIIEMLDDAVAGDIIKVVWPNQKQQKMSGTVITRLGINAGELEPYANQILVTLTVNGEPVPTVRKVLMANLLNIVDGSQRFAEPALLLPYDSTIGVELEVIADLGGTGQAINSAFGWTSSEFRPGLG